MGKSKKRKHEDFYPSEEIKKLLKKAKKLEEKIEKKADAKVDAKADTTADANKDGDTSAVEKENIAQNKQQPTSDDQLVRCV